MGGIYNDVSSCSKPPRPIAGTRVHIHTGIPKKKTIIYMIDIGGGVGKNAVKCLSQAEGVRFFSSKVPCQY